MYCSNCGQAIPKNAHFCPGCHTKIPNRFADPPQLGPGGHLYQNGLPVDLNDCALGSNFAVDVHSKKRGVFAELSKGETEPESDFSSPAPKTAIPEEKTSSEAIPLWPVRLICSAASFAMCFYFLRCCAAVGTFHMLARRTLVNLPGVIPLFMSLLAILVGVVPLFSKKRLAACIVSGELSFMTSLCSMLLFTSGSSSNLAVFLYTLITFVMFLSVQKEAKRGDSA